MRLSRVSADTCGSCSNLLQRSGVHHVYGGTRSKGNSTMLPNIVKITMKTIQHFFFFTNEQDETINVISKTATRGHFLNKQGGADVP